MTGEESIFPLTYCLLEKKRMRNIPPTQALTITK